MVIADKPPNRTQLLEWISFYKILFTVSLTVLMALSAWYGKNVIGNEEELSSERVRAAHYSGIAVLILILLFWESLYQLISRIPGAKDE